MQCNTDVFPLLEDGGDLIGAIASHLLWSDLFEEAETALAGSSASFANAKVGDEAITEHVEGTLGIASVDIFSRVIITVVSYGIALGEGVVNNLLAVLGTSVDPTEVARTATMVTDEVGAVQA